MKQGYVTTKDRYGNTIECAHPPCNHNAQANSAYCSECEAALWPDEDDSLNWYECGDCLRFYDADNNDVLERNRCPHCGSYATQPFTGPDADHAAESRFIPDRAESMYCG